MYRRSRFGDLNTVRVCEGPDGMTAGGGACSDGPSLACLRVEARFFCRLSFKMDYDRRPIWFVLFMTLVQDVAIFVYLCGMATLRC